MAGRKFVSDDRIPVELKLDADAPQTSLGVHVATGLHSEYSHLNHSRFFGVLERRHTRHPGHNVDRSVPANM